MRGKLSRAIAVATLLAGTPAAFADAGVKAVYKTSADELWKLVDFHQPSETIMPPIQSSTRTGEGLGALKVNALHGGGEVHLQLVYYAPEARSFNYIIQSSPLPVKNYVGEVRVTDLGDGRAELSWRGVYDANGVSEEEADKILAGFYEAIAAKIGETFPRE
jgi:hypothetical protein